MHFTCPPPVNTEAINVHRNNPAKLIFLIIAIFSIRVISRFGSTKSKAVMMNGHKRLVILT